MSEKISIVVPIYNVKQYLDISVESLLKQESNELEIILVDDGSADLSSVMCDEFASGDARITVVHKNNGGVQSSRKTGIEAASGEYLMIVDGDDWIDGDTVEKLAEAVRRDPDLDLIVFSHKKEYPNTSYDRHLFEKDACFNDEDAVKNGIYRRLFGLTNEELSHPEGMDYLSTCWGKLYRRSLALNAKFVNTSEVGSGEDGIFNMYALASCKRALYMDRTFYHYRYAAGSLTSKYRSRLAEQWKVLFSYMQRKIEEDNLPPDFREALNNRIALSFLGIGMNEMDNPDGNFFQFAKYMKRYTGSEDYRAAIASMRLAKLPFVWKMLLLCCKWRIGWGVAAMLKGIRLVKSKL